MHNFFQVNDLDSTEVLIIGGGATGIGLARDLALRGVDTTLIERGDLASGTSGRNHGLLHSGGRYVVKDPHSARQCIAENRVLKDIASHTIDPCGGMFVLPEGSDPAFYRRFMEGCRECGVPAEEIDTAKALRLEPALNPALEHAVLVPDGAVDPFQLILANALDAERHGARVASYHRVTGFGLDRDAERIDTVSIERRNGTKERLKPELVINVSGPWAGKVAALAGVDIPVQPSAGALLIAARRLVSRVINHMRVPSDGDIIVPHHTTSLLGTTSRTVSDPDETTVTPGDVRLIIDETARLVPAVRKVRLIRAFAGVRPLVALAPTEDGRALSRGFQIIEHREKGGNAAPLPGPENLMSVIGGKLTTYRLIAERCADRICELLGVRARCVTAEEPLPGESDPGALANHEPGAVGLYPTTGARVQARFGTLAQEIFGSEPPSTANTADHRPHILCECENVTTNEVRWSVRSTGAHTLADILRRTRAGMGTCQGGRCAAEIVAYLVEEGVYEAPAALDELRSFMHERYKGIRPVMRGEQLRQERFIEAIYAGVGNMDRLCADSAHGPTANSEEVSEDE